MTNITKILAKKIDEVKLVLADITEKHHPTTFTSSYGSSDLVLMDLIYKFVPKIEICTLDTGRLPAQTYELMQQIKVIYAREVRVYYPNTHSIEKYVTENGPNAFYDTLNLRKQCCNIRKVEPLKRALAGKKAWLTGMHRSQATTRSTLPISEYDKTYSLHKYNPLINWSNNDI